MTALRAPATAPSSPCRRAAPEHHIRWQAGHAAPLAGSPASAMPARRQAKLRPIRRCRQRAVLEIAQQPLAFAGDEGGNGVVFRRSRVRMTWLPKAAKPHARRSARRTARRHEVSSQPSTTPPRIRVGARMRNTRRALKWSSNRPRIGVDFDQFEQFFSTTCKSSSPPGVLQVGERFVVLVNDEPLQVYV